MRQNMKVTAAASFLSVELGRLIIVKQKICDWMKTCSV